MYGRICTLFQNRAEIKGKGNSGTGQLFGTKGSRISGGRWNDSENEDGEEGDIIGGIPSNIDIEGMFINEENKKQVLDKIEKVFNSLQDRQKSLISDILTIKLWLDLDETDEKYSFINKDVIKEWKKSGVLPTQREIAGKYERNEASVSRTVKDFQKKLKKEL